MAVPRVHNTAEVPTPTPLIHHHDDVVWDAHRDAIKQQYIDEKKTTLSVQRFMEESHGFKASVKQYERKFKKWALRKNHKQQEYASIDQELKRKWLAVNDAEVTLDNEPLSPKRLKRGVSRHVRPTMLSKWQDHPNLKRTTTGVCEPQETTICKPSTSVKVAGRPSLRQGKLLAKVDSVPWFDLSDSIAQQLLSSSIGLRASRQGVLRVSSSLDLSQQSYEIACAFHTKRTNEVLAAFNRTSQSRTQGQNLMAQEALFVERRKGDLKDTVDALRRSTDDALVAVLSYTFYLLSNNLADRSTKEALVNMFQATEAEAFGRALSSSSLLSARALVSQLLVIACEDYNLTLLEQLHEYGSDLNIVLPSDDGAMTALQIAMRMQGLSNTGTAFLERLLELGADPALCGLHSFVDVAASYTSSQSTHTTATECCCCSDLPMLESARRPDLVTVMLKHRARVCIHFDMTRSIEKGADASLVQALLDTCPELAQEVGPGETYFSPLQAAIAVEAFDVADVLLNNGVAMALSHSDDLDDWWKRYCGALEEKEYDVLYTFRSRDMRSPLALALEHGHFDIIAQCLSSGADPNLCYLDLLDDATELEQDFTDDLLDFEIEEIILEDGEDQPYRVFTPLQATIVSRSTTNVLVILDAGAELTCNFGLEPLVLAAMTGEKAIVQMLLARGAPVDGTSSFVPQGHRVMSPLAYASANGFVSIMEVLIQAGACINHCHPVVGLTPLQAAIAFEAPHSAVELLLSCPEVDVWHPGSLQTGTNAFVAALCNNNHVATGYLVSHSRQMLARVRQEAGLAACLVTHVERHWHQSCYPDSHTDSDGSCLAGPRTSGEVLSELVHIQKQLQACQVIRSDCSIAERVFEQAVRSNQTNIASMILQQGIKIPLRLSVTLLDFLLWSVVDVMQDAQSLESKYDLINLVVASQPSSWANAQEEGLVASALSAYYYCKHAPDTTFTDSGQFSILLDVVKKLVGYGVEVTSSKRNSGNVTALMMAVREGDLDTVTLMIEHGADVNEYVSCPDQITTPLQKAAHEGFVDIVDVLLQQGADVNKPPRNWGYSALGAACIKPDLRIVRKLIAAHADINAPADERGQTSLTLSACEGNQDIVLELIHSGADVNIAAPGSPNARTALQAACEKGHLDIVTILINYNADVDMVAFGGFYARTALQIACQREYLDIVTFLINHNADVNIAASGGSFAQTALQAACESGHLDIVTILINHNADVNGAAGPWYGVTALQAAAMQGYFKICQILIGCGAKVSAPAGSYEGRSAIDGASEWGRLDIVKFLLDHYDGDEDIVQVCGRARWFAREEGHMAVDELLATYKQSGLGRNIVLRPDDWREIPGEVVEEEETEDDDEGEDEGVSDENEILDWEEGILDEDWEISNNG